MIMSNAAVPQGVNILYMDSAEHYKLEKQGG